MSTPSKKTKTVGRRTHARAERRRIADPMRLEVLTIFFEPWLLQLNSLIFLVAVRQSCWSKGPRNVITFHQGMKYRDFVLVKGACFGLSAQQAVWMSPSGLGSNIRKDKRGLPFEPYPLERSYKSLVGNDNDCNKDCDKPLCGRGCSIRADYGPGRGDMGNQTR